MYMSPGHLYELKPPYNLMYIFVWENWDNTYDKWADFR